MTDLRWRIVLIVAIVGACLYAIIPPSQKIRRGLDLKGGVHLVLRVNTDDALKVDTETTMDQLRESVEKAGISGATFTLASVTRFNVSGVPPAQDVLFRQTAADVQTTYNREPGPNGSYGFVMKLNVEIDKRAQAVTLARTTIERRVNELGVAEPMVAEQGAAGDQLLVQLPGLTDVNHAKSIIQSTALLELKLVEQGPSSSKDPLLQATNGQVPQNMELVPGADRGGSGAGGTVYYLVRKVPVVTGRDLRNAKEGPDQNNLPAVHFSLNSAGAARFGKATGENIGRYLAIVLDGTVQSAPRIDGAIHEEGIISGGGFTIDTANDLALVLRSGALPASLTYLEERTIGPTLGADSSRSGIIASLVSLLLVAGFMLFYYKAAGINSIVALVFNLIILLGAMSYIGATMTLPGIAGFVLTMGIGVDSNVLIFERIKEELAAGRGVRASLNTGFSRVLITLIDTHVAALISAAFLFQFGTGPIRGFATTLTFGLISNLFTATFVSRTIFEIVLSRRQQVQTQAQTLSI
jgi:preprotein translocase subunit SecD